ncbi:MAG: hypothetical protein DLM58_09540, partial [Pseudonocardiales bacterium]
MVGDQLGGANGESVWSGTDVRGAGGAMVGTGGTHGGPLGGGGRYLGRGADSSARRRRSASTATSTA